MSEFLGILLGAILAIVGGAANDEIASLRERGRERKAISISISDELTEITQILNKIKTVWEATHTLIPSYIRDLKSCTSAYDALRQRLFLIKDENVRKEITTFYRDLKSAVNSDMRKAAVYLKTKTHKKNNKKLLINS